MIAVVVWQVKRQCMSQATSCKLQMNEIAKPGRRYAALMRLRLYDMQMR
jgi:hypothetical protein